MSNHFHLVVYSDPNAPTNWSDDDVIERWLAVCPPRDNRGELDTLRAQRLRHLWLGDSRKLAELRTKLGSVSVFMKLLKQPIARRANLEDGCSGHFFEKRFYSGALLDDAAVLAAMAYVDLNPVRAGIADKLEACRDTSIEQRLKHSAESVDAYLAPVITGLDRSQAIASSPAVTPAITLPQYVRLLSGLALPPKGQENDRDALWRSRLQVIGRQQRAFGALDNLARWLSTRSLAFREAPIV